MLETLYIGKNIIELDVVDSTNNYASDLVTKNDALEGTVVVAHFQGEGKGKEVMCGHRNLVKTLLFH